jgi:3-hydroxybutyryl-CoA dehydrogenase
MGQGIAQVTAAAGIETRLFDTEPGRAEKAVHALGAQLDRLVGKGRLTVEERQRTISALRVVPDARAGCEGVDLVVEAVPEIMELKAELLGEVVTLLPQHAIVGTNTSSLSVTELGARIGAADRTVGLHFFNPPPVMDLLEVVRGLATSEATLERALEFARRVGKQPIVVRDTPGFATSRLGVLLGGEAIRMLEGGVASAEDIDRAMELGYRHPMGPLKLTDLVGLDVRLAILENLHRELGEPFRPPVLLRQMVRAGLLGKKTGEGFYLWREGVPVPKPRGKGPTHPI